MRASSLPEHARLFKDITDPKHFHGILNAVAEQRNRQLLQQLRVAVTKVVLQYVRIEGVQALSGKYVKNIMTNHHVKSWKL